MKYPSPSDIEEMKSLGYDQSVIDEAMQRLQRWHIKEKVKQQIRHAFSGVRLGQGVGLHQAQGLDDYESLERCAELRESDEKLDWQTIHAEELNRCNSSLSFFDAEGMRFHLPAFLIADLDEIYQYGMIFTLTQSSLGKSQFALLDDSQRTAVRAYLLFVIDDPDFEWEREVIQKALVKFWVAQA